MIAGEAGELVIINHLNRTFTARDRFAGAGKVMLRSVAGGFARSHGAFDRVFKAAPHTREVLAEAGYSADEIEAMVTESVAMSGEAADLP